MKRSIFCLLFLLPLIFTAQSGKCDDSVGASKYTTRNASLNSVEISSGQSQAYSALFNLSIGGSNPVSVNQNGSITLTAGKSILLLPGTRISYGGFMYASIGSKSKSGNETRKEVRLVTIEENEILEEQASLITVVDLFSQFPTGKSEHLHSGDTEQGSFTTLNYVLSAVSPEQQRKVAIESWMLSDVPHRQIVVNHPFISVVCVFRTEISRVLRL